MGRPEPDLDQTGADQTRPYPLSEACLCISYPLVAPKIIGGAGRGDNFFTTVNKRLRLF
jgi:hypothetical protein